MFCIVAGLQAARRADSGNDVFVCFEDLLHALQTVQPSAMREVAIEVPNVCKLCHFHPFFMSHILSIFM